MADLPSIALIQDLPSSSSSTPPPYLSTDLQLAEELQLHETLLASLYSLAPPSSSSSSPPLPAASSSHSSPTPPRPRRATRIRTCRICLLPVSSSQMITVRGCLHRFCSTCMRQYASKKIDERIIPNCPNFDCATVLAPEQCTHFLPPEHQEKLAAILAEAVIPASDKVHCPYSNCSELFDSSLLDPSQVEVECLRCHRLFCAKCRVPWHARYSCPEYQLLPPEQRGTEDVMLLEQVAKKNKWKRCANCGSMIALSQGCYHMTCKCGYEFCYSCGAKWKTCKCKLWDERNLVRGRRHAH